MIAVSTKDGISIAETLADALTMVPGDVQSSGHVEMLRTGRKWRWEAACPREQAVRLLERQAEEEGVVVTVTWDVLP